MFFDGLEGAMKRRRVRASLISPQKSDQEGQPSFTMRTPYSRPLQTNMMLLPLPFSLPLPLPLPLFLFLKLFSLLLREGIETRVEKPFVMLIRHQFLELVEELSNSIP